HDEYQRETSRHAYDRHSHRPTIRACVWNCKMNTLHFIPEDLHAVLKAWQYGSDRFATLIWSDDFRQGCWTVRGCIKGRRGNRADHDPYVDGRRYQLLRYRQRIRGRTIRNDAGTNSRR